ncbi:MAG: AI-2E family transporter [Planctomycetaceae bacterium]|nr:AI-2E family transporter [Planctomycetaceae bacterium]
MTRLVSLLVLCAIVILCGVLFFQVMARFLLPMFLAVILVVMFRPLHQWFVGKCRGHVRIAAGLTTLAILVIVLAPLLFVFSMAAADGVALVTRLQPDVLLLKVTRLRDKFHLDSRLPTDSITVTMPTIVGDLEQLEEFEAFANPELANSLFTDIEGKVAQLEKELAATRPERAALKPGEKPPIDPEPTLADFQATLARLRGLQGLPQEEIQQQFDDTNARLSQLFTQFEREVTGGPLVGRLRQLANPSKKQLEGVQQTVEEWLGPLALSTTQIVGEFLGRFAIGLAVMIVSLYYFLADGPRMVASVMRLLPLDDRYERQMLNEFDKVSRAVVLAVLLSAVVQGALAGIGYSLAGLEAVFLLTVLTTFLALVPFVGAAAVWGSCALWLFFYEERTTAAVVLALYGVSVVSLADNVIKPIVLHGQSNLHPLLALLSVIGGVGALGPIGIFVGPMVVAFLQALLNMLQIELKALGDRTSAIVASGAPPEALVPGAPLIPTDREPS